MWQKRSINYFFLPLFAVFCGKQASTLFLVPYKNSFKRSQSMALAFLWLPASCDGHRAATAV